MQLIGQEIKHRVFGAGVVTGNDDRILTVRFSQGEKRFSYPNAFSEHLILQNRRMQDEIQNILKAKAAEEEAQRQAAKEKEEKRQYLRALKISDNAQAAFDIKQGQEEAVFSAWSVHTGHYLSGRSKGNPRIPNRMNPNSMCLLTQCEKGAPEKKRRIIGAFMVEEDFLGNYCRDGLIKAHPGYRLKPEPGSNPLFWPYIAEEPPAARWGNIAFKSFANVAASNILFDIKKALRDPKEVESAERFYRYFCQMNGFLPKEEM